MEANRPQWYENFQTIASWNSIIQDWKCRLRWSQLCAQLTSSQRSAVLRCFTAADLGEYEMGEVTSAHRGPSEFSRHTGLTDRNIEYDRVRRWCASSLPLISFPYRWTPGHDTSFFLICWYLQNITVILTVIFCDSRGKQISTLLWLTFAYQFSFLMEINKKSVFLWF